MQRTTVSSGLLVGGAVTEAAVEPVPMADSTATVAFVFGEAPEVEGHETVETDAAEEDLYEDPLDAIERHLAVLDSGSASEDAVSESTDALLTALGGGYEPETRFVIVKELLDQVDMDLRSLLRRHLEDIRDEARDFDKEELADRAERLLQRLELAQK